MVNLIRRDPFNSLFTLPRWMDDFDGFTQRGLRLEQTDRDIVARAVVAGVDPKNVDIDIEDGILTIKAEDKRESKTDEEYSSSSYQYYYTVALSGGQWDKADADIKHGVVTVTIPKTEASRPHKITVKPKA